jgi:hypothetical protein
LQGEDCIDICLWGITPGTSSQQDIDDLIMNLGQYGWSFNDPNYAGSEVDFDGEEVKIRLEYETDSDQIVTWLHGSSSSLFTYVDPREQPVNSIYDYVFQSWTMDDVIETYGTPTKIGMSLDTLYAEPPFSALFYTWFLYPDKGMFIRYEAIGTLRSEVEGIMGTEHDIASVCPAEAFIDVWLIADKSEATFNQELLEASYYWVDSSTVPDEFKIVMDAIGISKSEFVQRVTDNELGCFDARPRDWPLLH